MDVDSGGDAPDVHMMSSMDCGIMSSMDCGLGSPPRRPPRGEVSGAASGATRSVGFGTLATTTWGGCTSSTSWPRAMMRHDAPLHATIGRGPSMDVDGPALN